MAHTGSRRAQVDMWPHCASIAVLCTVTLAVDLSGVLTGNRMGSVPLGMTLGDGELDVEGVCNKAGVACQDCNHAVTCIALPVGWLKVPLDMCPEGQTCNARLGGCSEQAVPECDNSNSDFEHICEQVGIFPDAHDCRKFHLCSPPEDQPAGRPADHRSALCPMHYAFNASNAQCSVYLPYGQCQRKPVPECTKVGQSGALEDSLNHYYVCLSKQGALYPQIFICPHGYYFWNGFCQVAPPKEETNSETTGASLPSSSSTSSSSVSSSSASSSSASSESSSSESTSTAAVSRSSVKSTEYPPDAFLADRFDLTNYETIDDVENVPQVSYEFSSFESQF